ncbi:MAG: TonB-dependent receptor [Vicinamibacterales bacterium]
MAAYVAGIPVRAEAQGPGTAELAGSVADSTGAAVVGATVSVRDGGGRVRSATTDASGRFVVTGVAPGAVRVTVTGLGFEPRTVDSSAPAGAEGLRIELRPAGLEETVVVIGAASARRSLHPESADLVGSVDVMTSDQLEAENVDLSYELLKKMPGVYVNDFNQGVVAGGIGMRGFNTEGDINPVKLLVDGIPMNVNSGVADLNAIFPLNIDRIEVVKGTNDPRYGLFNIAGNVQVFTSAPGRYSKLKVLGGAFGTGDLQGTTAFSTGRLSHVYFAGVRTSTGYRDNSDLDRYAVSGKWVYTPASESWSVGLIARTYGFDTQAPGYLTLQQSQDTPRFSPAFSATDGGEQRTQHVSLHLDRQFQTVAVSVKAYRQQFFSQRFVRFTAAGAQQERLEDEAQLGALATVTWRPVGLSRVAGLVSAGADVQSQDNEARRFRTVERSREAVLRQWDFDFTNGGAYVMADVRPTRRLRVTGGVRADRVGGDFLNGLNGQALPVIDYGTIWQPKVGVLATVRDGVNLYGNLGRSFQVGVGVSAFGTQPLSHSKNDGWEGGVRLAPTSWLAARLGVWGQDASDELRLKFDNSGDSENVGKTRRRGWNIELTARPHPWVYAWATYTRQKATLVEPGATQPELKGKELDHTPRYTGKWGVDVTPTSRVTAALWTEAQGSYFLTTANTGGRFGRRMLTNVDLFIAAHRRLSLGVHLKNAFNGYHEYAWFDGATTLHSPGERRALYVTSTVEF